MMSGVHLRAAGVVPYTNRPGLGIHFLLQSMTNGSRTGKLCDFGGRREAGDGDAFFTAARELCEETECLWGCADVETLADKLRTSSKVRILNPAGRYVTFFVEVPFAPAEMLPTVDTSPDHEPVSRSFRWWRADELLGQVDDTVILERMLTNLPGPWADAVLDPSEPDSAAGALRGGTLGMGSEEEAEQEQERTRAAAAAAKPLSSFHRAVCKTLTLENAHPHAHERWHATVLQTIRAAEVKAARDAEASDVLNLALAAVEIGGAAATPATRPKSRPLPPLLRPRGSSSSASSASSASFAAAPSSSSSAAAADASASPSQPRAVSPNPKYTPPPAAAAAAAGRAAESRYTSNGRGASGTSQPNGGSRPQPAGGWSYGGRQGGRGGAELAPKRGSRRGPPQSRHRKPPAWHTHVEEGEEEGEDDRRGGRVPLPRRRKEKLRQDELQRHLPWPEQ